MFKHLIERLIEYGPLGLFLIGMLDSMGVPLPAAMDALLIAYSVAHPDKAYFAAAVAVVGSVGGNLLLFRAASLGGRRFVNLETPEAEQHRFRRWFNRYGLLTVFIPAIVPFLPLPLKVFVVTAGAVHTPISHFLGAILTARILRYFGEAYLGVLLGENAQGFLRDNAWEIVAAVAGAVLLFVAALKWYERRRASEA